MSGPLTVGTAGHIDHGKTALVKALTGRDTDRLAEEKARGISIELGFASLDLGVRRLSLIDAPGHERFVRTMIAGASGIDLFLMVIAADDGVMPQTREHARVLRVLGIDKGIVAVTKCDLVERGRGEEVAAAARALLPGVGVVAVSAVTGEGLDALRGCLALAAADVDATLAHADGEPARLYVDRVFTLKGRGTVVTGTLWSGRIVAGERLRVLPAGLEARVRSLQVHDEPREYADARQRVALNLAGLRREVLVRGDVIVGAGCELQPSFRLDIRPTFLALRPEENERVQVHHGTREAAARFVPLGEDATQLRLEAPMIAARGDRVVIRRISPGSLTLGGGTVLDPHPARHRSFALSTKKLRGRVDSPERSEGAEGERVPPPVSSPALRHGVLELLGRDGAMPRGPRALAESLKVDLGEVLAALDDLIAAGELIRVKPAICFQPAQLEALRCRAMETMGPSRSTSVAELRDALGISRKYSLALLEHLDSERVTLRRGERHVLRQGR